jgi:hypothetical protein
MNGLGDAIANAIIAVAVIAFVLGGAVLWLVVYLWTHIDVSVRWIS